MLVATPGRLIDLLNARELDLSATRWLVLDEADRMLDMGFINDVRKIAKATHAGRQTAMFSATMPAAIVGLANGLLRDPLRVEVAPQGTTVAQVEQSVVMARAKQKRQVLAGLLADDAQQQVLVFTRTKHGADRVTRDLGRDGFAAEVIHGNKSQNARQRALNGFRDGSVRILVATDIAARGIDVPGIGLVVNFELPDEPESYVHRIGRTGRNGASGIAVTLCDPSENAKLRQVERLIRKNLPVAASHLGEADPVRPAAERATAISDERRDAAAKRGSGRPKRRKPDHGRGVPYAELSSAQPSGGRGEANAHRSTAPRGKSAGRKFGNGFGKNRARARMA